MKLPEFKLNLDKIGNLVLIIACVFYLKNCGSVSEVEVIPDGYISPKEFEYRMEVINLIKQNQSLENEIRIFKTKYEKDTVDINNASFTITKAMFADRLKRR